jgi:2-succinyl-5-enolpyruvyl-6-hydroxy-3-cyclohexene-1-carboxylate synthase
VPPPSLALPESPPENGVIIAGLAQPQAAGTYCAAVGAIAQQLQYPVLAAGLSPVRHWQTCNPYLISTYEMILRDEQCRAQLRPQLVLQIGELPTSKILRQWLAQQQPERWLIDPHPENFDPLHGPVRPIPTTVTQLQLPIEWSALRDRAHLEKWLTLEVQFKQQRDRALAALEHCFEGKIVWLLAQILPVQTPLMIANSMPVRDVAYFTPVSDRQIQPYFNRGANGIDGTLSTALGIAHRHRPTVLLTGDLAFLHDTNGLLQCPRLVGHLTIIVVNNNGGGIFEMLPIAAFDPPFTEFFVTPQQVDLASLCAAYGVEYHAIATWSQLIALTEKLPRQGVRLLEIKTDRQADQRQRQAILG